MITAQNTITHSCSVVPDSKVMDDEGAEWVSRWYRGNRYFGRMGINQTDFHKKTVKKECKPCQCNSMKYANCKQSFTPTWQGQSCCSAECTYQTKKNGRA